MNRLKPFISGYGAIEAALSPTQEGLTPLTLFNNSLHAGIIRLHYDHLMFEDMKTQNLEFMADLGVKIPSMSEHDKREARQVYAILAARDYVLAFWSIKYLCDQLVNRSTLLKKNSPPLIAVESFLKSVDQSFPKLKNLRHAAAHALEFPEHQEKHSVKRSRKKDPYKISGGGQILISDGISDSEYFATY